MLKLGPHHMAGGDETTRAWLSLRPTIAKFCFGGFELAREASPVTLTIGRPDEQFWIDHRLGEGSPVIMGQIAFESLYRPHIAQYPYIQAWEGPNEYPVDDPAAMEWYAMMLGVIAERCYRAGKRAIIGNWSVGCPDQKLWNAYRPALDATREYGAILSRHSYGPLNRWLSLRHRDDQAIFRVMGYDPRVVITECGADYTGDGKLPDNYPGGWRKIWGNETDYYTQHLLPFAQALDQDDYILGATVFTVGTGFSQAWEAFNVGLTTVDNLRQYSPGPKPDGATHIVNAQALNVRAYPWIGAATPPVIDRLTQGQRVTVLGSLMGWALIGSDGNRWVSARYLTAL